MSPITFTCPDCGMDEIEEVMVDVVVSSIITNIHEEEECEYANAENFGGVVDRYQCSTCGYVIKIDEKPINDLIALYDWLKEHAGGNND